MAKQELPKIGDVIPVSKFHVSKANVRYGEPFGESAEDQALIANLRGRGRMKKSKVVEPFKARPEEKGYGVYQGRRRFLAEEHIGTKEFVVGQDCLIHNLTDEEAMEASLTENIDLFKKDMDPVLRAEKLAELVAQSPLSLRQVATTWGIPATTLSEWIKVRELSPKLKEALSKGKIPFSEGVNVARMELGSEKQEELGTVLLNDGLEAFQKALERIPTGKRKRGIPKGLYELARVLFDKRNRKHMSIYRDLEKIAEKRSMKVPDLILEVIIKSIDAIKKEYT